MTVRLEQAHAHATGGVRLDLARFLGPAILAGYGLFIVSLFLRGVMSMYINPVYIAPTTLAGAVLIGLSAVGVARKSTPACDANGVSSCGCDTDIPRLRTFALLGVPLFLALVFPPRSLASFSANQRGPQIAGMTAVHGSSAMKRVSLSVNTRAFSMQDWVGALSADPNPRDYLRKPIIISGLALHDSASVPPGYLIVIRYFVTCCIADARPVGLIVKDTTHGTLADNQWVSVTGVMGAANYQGQSIAVVEPARIDRIKSGNPYIY